MKRSIVKFVTCAFAGIVFLIPCHISQGNIKFPRPIIVRIDDVPDGPPVVTVKNAPNGYDIFIGPPIVDDTIEDGGLITLYGVDTAGTIDPGETSWKFVDPHLPPDTYRNATDIVWFQHDHAGDGSLQVGYNTHNPGGYYKNPKYTGDANAGPAINKWFTVYSDKTIILQFNPRRTLRQ